MTTATELSDFIKENDVKFVRFSFIDLDGRQRNLSVMAEELPKVMTSGMPFCAAAANYGSGAGDDLLLYPDVETIHILPWRPQHGRVARFLCHVKDADKKDVYFDSRLLLKNTLAELKEKGVTVDLGTDCEFYLFKTDDEGNPTKITHDHAGYFDIAPLDKGENVRREICLCLEEMGIKPLSSHHERGPGQNEINFIATNAMEACDNYMIFRSVVKAIASRNGLFASFLPKPIENESGNGLALSLSLIKDKVSLFDEEKLAPIAENFVAGIKNRALDTAILLNSYPNSYERLGEYDAPNVAKFGTDRFDYMRIAKKYGGNRLEFRSPDNACNVYVTLAALLKAGLKGIQNKEKLDDKVVALPNSLSEAIEIAKGSEFLKEALGADLLKDLVARKIALAEEYKKDKAEANRKAFERV